MYLRTEGIIFNMSEDNKIKPSNKSITLGVVLGVLYGVFLRYIFGLDHFNDNGAGEIFAVMSIGFIFIVPLVMGYLTTVNAGPRNVRFCIFMPWVSSLLMITLVGLIGWEGSVCIVMATPIFLVLSSIGGLIGGVKSKPGRLNSFTFPIMLLLPGLVSFSESCFQLPDEVRTVYTQIEIDASADRVWEQIREVKKIEADEHFFSVYHLIGFPKPIEASISGEGVGAVRHARFEKNLNFIETITEWEENEKIAFSIYVAPESIPATTLDEHVTIGGTHFDTLSGQYKIEQVSDDTCMLYLESKHRLSTRFNIYSGQWTDSIMSHIQSYILKIIKQRCETQNG